MKYVPRFYLKCYDFCAETNPGNSNKLALTFTLQSEEKLDWLLELHL